MEIKEELLDIHGIKNSKKNLLDLFIRRTAVLTQTSERLTELIIKDQWRSATKVSQPGSPIKEIEFPNIGAFYLSPTKATKRLETLEKRIRAVEELPQDNDMKVMERRLLSIQRYHEQKKNIKVKLKTDNQ